MAGLESIGAFLAFCKQRNPRFVHPIPQRTPYEQMLVDLEDGDAAVLTAFNWARQAQNAPADTILAEWRRYAESERASVRESFDVRHTLAPSPPHAQLEDFRVRLGGASPELLEFYGVHDGASLFADVEDGGSGLFFFPLAEMAAEREGVAERLEEPAVETVEDGKLQIYGKPAWLDSAVVFGGFGYAPERLLLPTAGEHRGEVFLFSHDPLQLVQLGTSFGELLDHLRLQPISLLGSYGGNSYQGATAYVADGLP
ncbi:SMI1/KNR4 family protein [Nevskia soli]|uniref:SMI1/KNR4 family protein n=1 Tax=Nevskia soli TaxID=418856 RepID=UPI0004A77BC2|nr:SMI1/KNR4 family protein [Nevskia soli]